MMKKEGWGKLLAKPSSIKVKSNTAPHLQEKKKYNFIVTEVEGSRNLKV